jgi:hypothetical protein
MYDIEQRISRKAFQRYVSVSVTALSVETNQSSQTGQTMSMSTAGSDSRQTRNFTAYTPPATPVACVATKGSDSIDLELLILIYEFQAKAEIQGQSSKASAIYFSNYRGAPISCIYSRQIQWATSPNSEYADEFSTKISPIVISLCCDYMKFL